MLNSIAHSLIVMAVMEGESEATRQAENLLEALETLCEIGSFDERQAAALLLSSVKRGIEEINDGTLIKVVYNRSSLDPVFPEMLTGSK